MSKAVRHGCITTCAYRDREEGEPYGPCCPPGEHDLEDDIDICRQCNHFEGCVPSDFPTSTVGDDESDQKGAHTMAAKKPASIETTGDKLIIPDGMSYDKAITELQRKRDYEEETTQFNEIIDGYPLDVANALSLAIEEQFGWSSAEPIPGFFGPTPPQIIAIPKNFEGETVNVAVGRFTLPNIAGWIQTGLAQKNGRVVFSLVANVKRKHEEQIRKLCALTREMHKNRSLYRGQAIRVKLARAQEFDPTRTPTFVDVRHADADKLVFPALVQRQVDTNLFKPVDFYERLKDLKVPFKRGVLLAGPFGTGKTALAAAIGKKATMQGMTFIYCEDPKEFSACLEFARMYQPAVVFCEDIDRVLEGARDAEMDKILNTIDGVENKTAEVMVVLTTNAVERINKAMIRPGRLDAVIEVTPPDADAAEKLIRLYAGKLLDSDESLAEIGVKLEGMIPAVIREVVERAKLASIEPDDEEVHLTAEGLMIAAESMAMQVRLLNEEPPAKSREVQIVENLTGCIVDAMRSEEQIDHEINRFTKAWGYVRMDGVTVK